MLIEICANSYQSALNAQQGGAHRIELCSELAVGGITPSHGLIKQVIRAITIPVFVLIRPRSGDFCYSEDEFEIMKSDIDFCKEIGCAGIVSGVLHSDNCIDLKRTQELIEISKPLDFTFHRAFDCVTNPIEELHNLASIGVKRILTSGTKATAQEGFSILKDLLNQQINDFVIMPGSGINIHNIQLFKQAGFSEIHTSASTKVAQTSSSLGFGTSHQTVSDTAIIQQLVTSIQHA